MPKNPEQKCFDCGQPTADDKHMRCAGCSANAVAAQRASYKRSKPAKPPRAPNPRWFSEEDRQFILTHSNAECAVRFPDRKINVISAQRYKLKHGEKSELKNVRWSNEELTTLRDKYSSTPNKELRQCLPGRSTDDILYKARSLKLRKRPSVAPTIHGHKELVHKLILQAKGNGIAMYWLDRLCGTGKYFSHDWRKWPVNLEAVSRAVELLGGRLDVVFTLQPFGTESRRLIECLARFGRAEAPKVTKIKEVKSPANPGKGAPLSYPYLGKSRADASVVEAVNQIVPKGMLGREDVCQEILLALHAGSITIDDLRRNKQHLSTFFRSFMRGNFERGGHAVSLDEPMKDGRSRHDVLADTAEEISAEEDEAEEDEAA